MTYHPPQCTERESGDWEDCTWASGVMMQNAAYGTAKVPSTQQEYEALRKASGDSMTGGSNIGDLVRGFKARYKYDIPNIEPDDVIDLWGHLKPGTGAVVQGSMGALSDYWRRHDPDFSGAHAVYVSRDDDLERVWWMNPLAPASYPGEYMYKVELMDFWDGLEGARINKVVIGSRGEDVGVKVNITAAWQGKATVRGDGHSAFQLADGEFIAVPDGQVREVYAKGTLGQEITSGNTTFPVGTKVVLIGTETAALFEADVELVPGNEYVPVEQLYVRR